MRIGIDIDDTLTNVRKEINDAGLQYAKELHKPIENIITRIYDKNNDGSTYQKIFDFSYDELKYFLGTIQENITDNALPRENCVEIIQKLHDDGNEIYIITARDYEFHKDPYSQSIDWLNKNHIYFDKLIVNARDKGKACLEEKVDLLIDDSFNNCKKAIMCGIPAIMIKNKQPADVDNIRCFKNWIEIYDYITKEFIKESDK